MQRNSSLKISMELKTAFGQLLMRVQAAARHEEQRKTAASFLISDPNITLFVKRHGTFSQQKPRQPSLPWQQSCSVAVSRKAEIVGRERPARYRPTSSGAMHGKLDGGAWLSQADLDKLHLHPTVM